MVVGEPAFTCVMGVMGCFVTGAHRSRLEAIRHVVDVGMGVSELHDIPLMLSGALCRHHT